jgi:hypothetical protein
MSSPISNVVESKVVVFFTISMGANDIQNPRWISSADEAVIHSQNPLRASVPEDLEQRIGPGRYALYLLIIKSKFYIEDLLEPTVDSDEAKAMFLEVQDWDILPGSRSRGKSIYYVFIEGGSNRCRFCGAQKTSLYRVLGCVRSHLNHRPFQCSGSDMGCKICPSEAGYVHLILCYTSNKIFTYLLIYVVTPSTQLQEILLKGTISRPHFLPEPGCSLYPKRVVSSLR